MRKLMAVAAFLMAFASLTMAQTSFEVKWHCAKPLSQQYDIGDTPGHSYGLAQGKCDAIGSKTGEKSGVFTEHQEMWKDSFETEGRMIVTMVDGEKTFYTYRATGKPTGNTAEEKWSMEGGTGKYKGNKGTGTCSGSFRDDGSSEWSCKGSFTTGT